MIKPLQAIKEFQNYRSFKKRIKFDGPVPESFRQLISDNQQKLGQFARENGCKLHFSHDEKTGLNLDLYDCHQYVNGRFTCYEWVKEGSMPVEYNSEKPANTLQKIMDNVLNMFKSLDETQGSERWFHYNHMPEGDYVIYPFNRF